MGTTFTTLNVRGAERAALDKLLLPTDRVWDINPPWLTVVPPYETAGDDLMRLEKIAKKLTKQSDAAAISFYYFDDDNFYCTLYQGGKKTAQCHSGDSWAKLAKRLGELTGDDAFSKAFRYSSRCVGMEEEIDLLEETLGMALFALQDDEPRVVKRGDATLQAIKAREAMLKKRPNKFRLTEIEQGAWPQELKYRQKLFDTLRPQWREFGLSFFMYQTDMERYLVPGTETMIAYPYWSDYNTQQSMLLLMDGETGERSEFGPFSGTSGKMVWRTKKGDAVIMLSRYRSKSQEKEEAVWLSCVICLSSDGTEQWRFQLELNEYQTLQFVHASEQGVITLFAPGINAMVKADAHIFTIDGETGRLLYERSYPYSDSVYHMIHVGAMDAFMFCRRATKELVLLNGALEEIQTFAGYTGSDYLRKERLCGSVLWEGDCFHQRFVKLFDLTTGAARKTPLEIPAYVLSVLADGRILGANEKQNALTVFDPEGIVTARCKVPGTLSSVLSEDGNVYLIEVRGPDTHGFVYDELFDETKIHVWRLDEA